MGKREINKKYYVGTNLFVQMLSLIVIPEDSPLNTYGDEINR